MPSPKHQHFRGGRGRGVELNSDEVHDHKPEQERNQNPEVAPDVRVRIGISDLDVVLAVDGALASDGAFAGAYEGIAVEVGVGRDELGAGEFAAVELVGDEDFEGVVDWVDVAEPAELHHSIFISMTSKHAGVLEGMVVLTHGFI